jgi:hypothetical protein
LPSLYTTPLDIEVYPPVRLNRNLSDTTRWPESGPAMRMCVVIYPVYLHAKTGQPVRSPGAHGHVELSSDRVDHPTRGDIADECFPAMSGEF